MALSRPFSAYNVKSARRGTLAFLRIKYNCNVFSKNFSEQNGNNCDIFSYYLSYKFNERLERLRDGVKCHLV